MVEFEVLEDDNLIALRGETARLFLSEQGYQKVLHSQELGKNPYYRPCPCCGGHIIRPKRKKTSLTEIEGIIVYKVKYLQEELTSLFRTRDIRDGNPAERTPWTTWVILTSMH